MDELDSLKRQIKQTMVEELMLDISAEEIGDDTPIFSPHGLGLDSVDALQFVVAVEKRFGLRVPDATAAREIMRTVNTVADAISASKQPA